jgi:hypothetical protein
MRSDRNQTRVYGVMADMRIPKLHAQSICLILAVLLCGFCFGQDDHAHAGPDALILLPSAADVKRSDERCQEMEYVVVSNYPGTDVLSLISDELRRRGWSPASAVDRKFMRYAGDFKSAGRWEHFKNVAGGTTYTRAEQWSNGIGDVVSYNFWYENGDLNKLRVFGRFCGHEYVVEHRCVPGPPKPHDEKAYSLSMKIDRVEPIGKDFKVFVRIQNVGSRPVFLGLNGKHPDGDPELWVLDVEQEEQGEWGSVGAVCAELGPPDWIALAPGREVDSWALAVDFPEPNYRFGMCRRRIAHLHGKIRAAIRYYTGVCEIENSFNSADKYTAISEPVELLSR